MKQFLLPRGYRGEPRLTLLGGEYRYLARVLRMKEGDVLPAIDIRGGRYTLRVLRVGGADCEVGLEPLVPAAAPSDAAGARRIAITLVQCLPKGRKIDLIVRQATEAGVARILPVFSEHTVVRPGEDDARMERLRRIAREALQQSGSATLPEIGEPKSLAETLQNGENWGTALFFHEQPVACRPLHSLLADARERVTVVIGPEGGLSGAEVELLTAAGFQPVHLRTGVLRVETAATFALGAVMTIIQERGAWKTAQAE
jgi:16S rRNA (uracil1498-N3)-methyltransferase